MHILDFFCRVLRLQHQFIQSIDWGTVPAWLSAIGTSSAFGIAALAYRRDVRLRREAQARLVYSKTTTMKMIARGDPAIADGEVSMSVIGGGVSVRRNGESKVVITAADNLLRVRLVVHNGSAELVSKVQLHLVDSVGQAFPGSEAWLNPVDPKSEYLHDILIRNPAHPGLPSTTSVLTFRDSRGGWWRRAGDDSVVSISEPPQLPRPTKAGSWQPVDPNNLL